METNVHHLREHWESAVSHTRTRSPATFDRWFSTVQLDGLNTAQVSLRARDGFVRDWVTEHYLPTILQYLRLAAGMSPQVSWTLGEIETPLVPPPPDDPNSTRIMRPSPARPVPQRRPTSATPQPPAAAPYSAPHGFGPAPAALAPSSSPSLAHPAVIGHTPGLPSPAMPLAHAAPPSPAHTPLALSAHAPPGHHAPFSALGHAINVPHPGAHHAPSPMPPGLPPGYPSPLDLARLTPSSLPSNTLPHHGMMYAPPVAHASPVAHEPPPSSDRAHSAGYAPPVYGATFPAPAPASVPPPPPRVEVNDKPPPSRPDPAPRPHGSPPAALALEGLNPKYTFENFVVGPSNELAHAAAQASAGGGGRRYSPLFLCGGTGLGKTHLLQAIAYRVLSEQPHKRIIYVSAERFTNDFIAAIQNKRMEAFRAHYRSECDLLLVDDIQFLAGREQTQEEFFHTFNALHELDRPIVFSSDKYPQQLERMEERLVSRFSWGLVADVQAPELETRVAILRKKAQVEGILLDDQVALFLAQTISSNVRELEGTLIRLAAKASLTHRRIDLPFAQSELSTVSGRGKVLSIDDIQRAVCTHFHLRPADLMSKDRHKTTAFARHVAMYLCKQKLPVSFPEVGRAFGKDHTTVMSAVRKVEALREQDAQMRAHLEAIEKKLAGLGALTARATSARAPRRCG